MKSKRMVEFGLSLSLSLSSLLVVAVPKAHAGSLVSGFETSESATGPLIALVIPTLASLLVILITRRYSQTLFGTKK